MIELIMSSQPDDESCGPTSLYAIYKYYGLNVSHQTVIDEVERSMSGGTLSPLLGLHALTQGFKTNIYIHNLHLFDPSWFENGRVDSDFLYKKLKQQMRYKRKLAIQQESKAYLKYLKAGGTVSFKTLDAALLQGYFLKNIPILTGLSATYLYDSPRECYTTDRKVFFDDIRGDPCGHFVVLCGFDTHNGLMVVADPHRENPISKNNYYKVSSQRLINAIMLGVTTYDASILIIEPSFKGNP